MRRRLDHCFPLLHDYVKLNKRRKIRKGEWPEMLKRLHKFPPLYNVHHGAIPLIYTTTNDNEYAEGNDVGYDGENKYGNFHGFPQPY